MDINAEMSKAFGTEIAKIFSATIPDEEIKETAKNLWNLINTSHQSYFYQHNNNRNETELEREIKSVFIERVKVEFNEIIDSEEYKERIKLISKNIMDDIISETRKKMVDEISNRLTELSTGHYGVGIKTIIEQTVYDMIKR